MSKTITEIADDYSKEFLSDDYREIAKQAFLVGASSQHERDKEKATKAFCNHCGCTHNCDVRGIECLWLEKFKQELEEE